MQLSDLCCLDIRCNGLEVLPLSMPGLCVFVLLVFDECFNAAGPRLAMTAAFQAVAGLTKTPGVARGF